MHGAYYDSLQLNILCVCLYWFNVVWPSLIPSEAALDVEPYLISSGELPFFLVALQLVRGNYKMYNFISGCICYGGISEMVPLLFIEKQQICVCVCCAQVSDGS